MVTQMNIYDISEKAGVSIATVSRVLNNNPNVSTKTREKVLAVMAENGYTPNAYARGLGLGTMHTVGLLCADSSDPFLATAIYFLERELRINGYDALLCCTGYEHKDKQNYLKLLLSKKVDGIILVGSQFIEQSPAKNRYITDTARKIPVMLINGYLKGEGIYCVQCDDKKATYEATSKVIVDGAKNPVFLHRAPSYSGLQKREGFLKALTQAGISHAASRCQLCPGDSPAIHQVLSTLYDSHHAFDAVIASDDELAIQALKFAKTRGLRVPADMAVIGYNNSKISTYCEPELTSVDNRLETLCIQTVHNLMQLFSGKQPANQTTFSAPLILRGTTL